MNKLQTPEQVIRVLCFAIRGMQGEVRTQPFTTAEVLACGCNNHLEHCDQCDQRRKANADASPDKIAERALRLAAEFMEARRVDS